MERGDKRARIWSCGSSARTLAPRIGRGGQPRWNVGFPRGMEERSDDMERGSGDAFDEHHVGGAGDAEGGACGDDDEVAGLEEMSA